MKAEELRIGNYVFWNEPKKLNLPHKVVLISDEKIHTKPISLGESLGDYLPIPLTEDWLEKFGYKYDDIANIWFIDDGTQIDIFKKHNNRFVFDIACAPEMEYVHRFQNLYFELTDEELTIS